MAYLALIFNALIWGLSWWPFRQFQAAGLHPLWATVTLYLISLGVISLSAGRAWREFLGTPSLWLIMLAAGATNTAFNWGVALGDVVRVVLLFYLMPLWAVLLARLILGERLTGLALLRMMLALGGAAVVLAPEQGGFPLPSGLADWLGVLGGFTFALNNVMLRRESHRGAHARALAMFSGGVLVAGSAALLMGAQGMVPWPSLPGWIWLLPLTGMAVLFFFSNLALQYGAARLPANVTAIVMLVEVPAAAISALWLGGGSLDLKTAIGGACIVAAAVLAALERNSGH
ncbi:DMT family transporter [Paucibacter sp. PLA-PC-4]|uniref:DMT family transporter n=1 Tax=Paucibacter sp. PLA-PC-4 TaxID=2993655 RepID=UPI00224B4472|nr:DMT family transporter [Paucibacter sp. PLA-PC-4]MCX2864383.1 DMT family transporter [Paucibacter sp. PLA-PC-4]